MPIARSCTECGGPMTGRRVDAKTCGQECRQKRARRIRKLQAEAARMDKAPPVVQTIREMVAREQPDEVKKVLHEELRPIVREALTEETLRAIQRLLGLTDKAVQVVQEDLESDDAVLRSKAAALLLKYTVGHPALVKADDADGSKQLNISFAMPRPDSIPVDPEDVHIEELRTCDMCSEEKPASEFVGNSERCEVCVAEWKKRILEQIG